MTWIGHGGPVLHASAHHSAAPCARQVAKRLGMLLQKERKAIEDIASENKKKAHEKAKASGNLANFKAGLQGSEVSETIAAVKKWEEVIMRTNEAYVVAEACEEAFLKVRRDCTEIASRLRRKCVEMASRWPLADDV